MAAEADLLRSLAAALEPEDRRPPPDRVEALRAAAARRPPSHHAPTASTSIPARRSLRLVAIAAVVAAVLGFTAGRLVPADEATRDQGRLAGGVVEFETTLVDANGTATATAIGIRTGIGRVVQFRADDLPILPAGELYELWFVGPNDTPLDPERISAGTFHPDAQGRADVDLAAAADPAKYPELYVTAEPGDGDPRPSGSEVLRAEITLDRP